MNPNILLIVLDSVRARNTSIHGYQRPTTPFLEEYTEEATLYEQARSPGMNSRDTHASMWTGTEVEEHQLFTQEDELRSNSTIWESLAKEGYKTGLFTTNTVVTHTSNLSAPFETVVSEEFTESGESLFPNAHNPADVQIHEGIFGNLQRCARDDQPIRSLLNSAYHYYQQNQKLEESDTLSSEELLDEFLTWQRNQSGSWAACLNLMDAHYPYEPDSGFGRSMDNLKGIQAKIEGTPADEFIQGRSWWQLEAFEHLYDSAIHRLDSLLSDLIKSLKDTNSHDDTLVVITSDHGEGFGEFSPITGRTRMVDHSWGLHEVLTHIPLLVKYPHQKEAERVIEPATLSQFPAAVRKTIDGKRTRRSFVPGKPVIASTRRLLEQHADIFEGSDEDKEDYLGPWRAVYEGRENGTVRKYITKGECSQTIAIHNAQISYPVNTTGSDVVDRIFSDMEPKNVKSSNKGEVSGDVEDRLSELGYL